MKTDKRHRKPAEPNVGAMAAAALDVSKRGYLKKRCGRLRKDNDFIDQVREYWKTGLDCLSIQAKLRSRYRGIPVELIEDIVGEECAAFYAESEPHKCSGCGAFICTDVCVACSVRNNSW